MPNYQYGGTDGADKLLWQIVYIIQWIYNFFCVRMLALVVLSTLYFNFKIHQLLNLLAI